MERAEPTFVPEWYKGAGGGSSSSAGLNHYSRSSSHSDEHGNGLPFRNRLPVSACDHEAPRLPAFTDRSSSAFRQSASSNGSISHDKDSSSRSRPYSSFSRSHRDRDREKDLDVRGRGRSFVLDNGICDSFKSGRTEKETLRRSHSMISGRHIESWPKRPGKDLSNVGHSASSMAGGISKASFERDFPSLGTEELQRLSDVSRVSSPGPTTATQSLPIGSSAMMDSDGWTSALVEPPAKAGGTGAAFSSASQAATVNLPSTILSTTAGLNMAEALSQALPRAFHAPQLLVDTQRIEELTRIQYTKLIPVTPSTPKSSVLNSCDKSKLKASKSGELSTPVKFGQPSSSQIVNQSPRGPSRSDTPKTSQAGNFQVLNRERNGIHSAAKEVADTNGSRGLAPVSGVASVTSPLKTPINPKIKVDSKGGVLTSAPFGEKRSLSQAQKRSDFFNTLRKKAAVNQSAIIPDLSCVASSSNSNKLSLQAAEISSDNQEIANHTSKSDPNCLVENGKVVIRGCDAREECERFVSDGVDVSFCSELVVDPDEEEAAFLRSLGWEENAGEEALTAEEISAFFKEYEKLRPSSKVSH